MPLDKKALEAGLGKVEFADQLCRTELSRFNQSVEMVTCTQEAALFQELNPTVKTVNIREMGLWSVDAKNATAKTIALIKAAKIEMPPVKLTTLESKGVTLIYGVDETAFEIANALKDTLDITVLLKNPKDIAPPSTITYPVVKGTITKANGVLGAFDFTIDDYALPLPSSRSKLLFSNPQNGASSTCDIFIDLTGGNSFFPAHELREGYLKAAPNDTIAKQALIHQASQLIGVFDKPVYIDYKAELCAHSRSKITGCTKCLDVCPTGAITPLGDKVLFDTAICAGCGACASVCPSGAANYTLPSAESQLKRVRVLLETYLKNDGKKPILFFHDEQGMAQLEALARHAEGLPANVLPVRVNEIYSLPLEFFTSSMTLGAAHIVILTKAKPKHDLTPLKFNIQLADEITSGLGYGSNLVSLLETDDYEAIYPFLKAVTAFSKQATPSSFLPLGGKRSLLEVSLKEMNKTAPTPKTMLPLSKGAPMGSLIMNEAACTLCLSCVAACPASALSDNSEKPQLRFTENLCLQCGLCAKTCPENALTLLPQIDFEAWGNPRRILKEEEPFACVECGTEFGTKAAINKVMTKLSDHWMFSNGNEARLRHLQLCDKCRVTAVINESFDPHAKLPPKPRTNEDYQ